MAKQELAQDVLCNTDWMESDGEMRDVVTDSRELAAGLLFLLKEYYIGSFDLNEDGITIKFKNDQQFSISVKERA